MAITSTQLKPWVQGKLRQHPLTRHLAVVVGVRGEALVLQGWVSHPQERRAAERVAQAAAPEQSVINEIQVWHPTAGAQALPTAQRPWCRRRAPRFPARLASLGCRR